MALNINNFSDLHNLSSANRVLINYNEQGNEVVGKGSYFLGKVVTWVKDLVGGQDRITQNQQARNALHSALAAAECQNVADQAMASVLGRNWRTGSHSLSGREVKQVLDKARHIQMDIMEQNQMAAAACFGNARAVSDSCLIASESPAPTMSIQESGVKREERVPSSVDTSPPALLDFTNPTNLTINQGLVSNFFDAESGIFEHISRIHDNTLSEHLTIKEIKNLELEISILFQAAFANLYASISNDPAIFPLVKKSMHVPEELQLSPGYERRTELRIIDGNRFQYCTETVLDEINKAHESLIETLNNPSSNEIQNTIESVQLLFNQYKRLIIHYGISIDLNKLKQSEHEALKQESRMIVDRLKNLTTVLGYIVKRGMHLQNTNVDFVLI